MMGLAEDRQVDEVKVKARGERLGVSTAHRRWKREGIPLPEKRTRGKVDARFRRGLKKETSRGSAFLIVTTTTLQRCNYSAKTSFI